MFLEFLWDVFGLSLGDKIFAVVAGIGVLLTFNGIILTAFYYRQALKLIRSKISRLPDETESLLSLRKEALKKRKASIDSAAEYLACNWKIFEKFDDLVADDRISTSSLSANSSFSLYMLVSPLEVIPKLSSAASFGIMALFSGQLILALTIPGSIIFGLVMIGALVLNSSLAAKYEAVLNSIKSSVSKAVSRMG